MESIARPAPAGTFNATPVDIEDLIGRTTDPVAALGARIAQVDVLAGIDLNNVITLPAAPKAAKARAVDARNELRHDPVAGVAFLKMLDPNGWHNLWTLHPETGVKTGRTFAPNSWDEIAAFIDAHQDANIYFSLNEPKPDAPHDKLKKKHIATVRAVWGDFDPNVKLEKAGEGRAERDRISALSTTLIADSVAPPSCRKNCRLKRTGNSVKTKIKGSRFDLVAIQCQTCRAFCDCLESSIIPTRISAHVVARRGERRSSHPMIGAIHSHRFHNGRRLSPRAPALRAQTSR
jgi:hypothetical protein